MGITESSNPGDNPADELPPSVAGVSKAEIATAETARVMG
jgi:hypothetical protein